MDDDGIIDVVLRIKGNLTVDGYLALSENFPRLDDAAIVRLNRFCPAGVDVGRWEVLRALEAALESIYAVPERVQSLRTEALAAESVRRWDGYPHTMSPEPIDLSLLVRLFRACNPDSPDYDYEFHLALFREKPHFFCTSGLPSPRAR